MPNLELTPQETDLVAKVKSKVTQAQESMHNKQVDKWDRLYNYYRAFTRFSSEYRGLTQRERDAAMREAQQKWGSEMHVPYGFSTIETIVPRLLANNPRMLVTPRERRAEETVENMRFMVNVQQEQIRYPMKLQTIAKDGLIYGLGVGKTCWRREEANRKSISRGVFTDWVESSTTLRAFDDPDVEAVDPRDFLWDPTASDIDSMGWAVHRTWRNTGYILAKCRSGAWNLCEGLTAEDLNNTNKTREYVAQRHERSRAGDNEFDMRTNDMHEVWEFHNRTHVIVVVDGAWPVHASENPYWHGDLPFQIYRPTEVTHELVGVSVIEIISDLIDEMNTMRMQRRDNATIVLQKPFIFNSLYFDSADLALGPGLGIPTTGDVNDSIRPIEFGDIPFSGYREEDNLRADIERTSAVSDSVAGGEQGSASQTATGAQLLHDAANLRIKNMTFRIENEIITPQARQFVRLNQQYITESREIPLESHDPTDPDRRYTWFTVGPAELAGEMNITAIGGSTAADNIPQKRSDAQQLWGMFGNDPRFNGTKIAERALREGFDIENAEELLAPEQPMVPAETLNAVGQFLSEQGVPPEMIQAAVDQGLAMAEQDPSQPQDPSAQPQQPEGAMNG